MVDDLTDDPEPRYTSSGAVASFTIASTPRTFDCASNEMKDSEALFLHCSLWCQAAENVADGLGSAGRSRTSDGRRRCPSKPSL